MKSIPMLTAEITPAVPPPSKTYALDFENKRITGYADGTAAVEQFIKKTLLTERFRHLIYDNQYGSEIKSTVFAQNASRAFIEAEIPRVVKDALLCDARIREIHNFDFKIDGDAVRVAFEAETDAGNVTIREAL